MSIENDIAEIETNIENIRKAIARADKLERLLENKDFKDLFIDGYLKDEAARVVKLECDPMVMSMDGIQGKAQRKMLVNTRIGIGALEQYIDFVRKMGNHARQALAQNEETHSELLKEQMGGEQ